MVPTLHDGDLLLVRFGAAGRVGGLALVRLPGDRPLAVKRLTAHDTAGWWAERDNPREGVDSWQVGVLPDEAVVARVLGRVWPIRIGR